MNDKTPYPFSFNSFLRKKNITKGILFAGLLLFFLTRTGFAQQQPEYDEISVFLQVQGIGGIEIPALIRDQVVYLPVSDIFDFLKIKTTLSSGLDSVSGFFINPQSPYLIDKKQNRILYQGKQYNLNPYDLIRTETNLYLNSTYFGQVFGLDCMFTFRSLSVMLTTKLELPVIREMRIEQMRQNIRRLKGEVKADTTIGRSYPLFHFGMADWSVISTQQMDGQDDTRLNLALGSVIAGGEANAFLNYNTNEPFTEKQQYYYWRFVNNDNRFLRQTIAGKITSQAVSSIYNPVVGVQFTNTPTTYRRSFGTYTLTDYTEPGWIVELYVNNVLVDYKKADASGFFTFEVPLVYGNSLVKLRFYGPWGEERSKEQNMTIPFSFLPPDILEYTVGAGMVEDDKESLFSRTSVNYGVARNLTMGGGIEYLSSVTTGTTMPFLLLSLRAFHNMLVSGEYTYGVRSKGILSYQLPKNMQVELNYTRYERGQKAVNFNFLEERKAIISIPFRGQNFAFFSRITLDQIILPATKYSTAEWLISGAVLGVSTNLTTYALFIDPVHPYTYSNLSLSFRLPAGFLLTPQAQYEYRQNDFISMKFGLEKKMFRYGYLTASYEQNFKSNIQSTQIGFRYDFSFAQTGVSARQSNSVTTLVESAMGSLMLDSKTGYLGASNRTSVGKGGITVVPYLDLNCNNRRDDGEPKAYGLNLHVNGGRLISNEHDTTMRVFDLEPYTSYLVEPDRNSFDNVAWQIRKKTISVVVDPNQFKLIEIPVAVFGEVSGMVYRARNDEKKGQGRIILNFYDHDSKLAGRTLSEDDGYYSFLGLPPGSYTARVDTAQLHKLQLVASPSAMPVTILQKRDGDVAEGIDFILTSMQLQGKSIKDTLLPVTDQSRLTEKQKDSILWQKILTRHKEKSIKDTLLSVTEQSLLSKKQKDSIRLQMILAHHKEKSIKDTFLSVTDQSKLAEKQKDSIHLQKILAHHIKFNVGKNYIEPEELEYVLQLADQLEKNPNIIIVIEGHCDSDGSLQYNQKLSEIRAQAIKDVLVKLGMDSSRIQTIGYGKTRPLNKNANRQEKSLNRRVVILKTKG